MGRVTALALGFTAGVVLKEHDEVCQNLIDSGRKMQLLGGKSVVVVRETDLIELEPALKHALDLYPDFENSLGVVFGSPENPTKLKSLEDFNFTTVMYVDTNYGAFPSRDCWKFHRALWNLAPSNMTDEKLAALETWAEETGNASAQVNDVP